MKPGRLALCGALLASAFAAETDTVRALRLAREAVAEEQAPEVAIAKLEEAIVLRPDYPRIHVNLAAAQVAAGRADDALATLERLARLGLTSPVEKSAEFAALRGRKEFEGVVKKLAANNHPKGAGEIAFSLRGVTGLLEGIAWRAKTGAFYFGDVNGRAVWVRGPDEALRRVTPEGDDLLGVFGLAIDEVGGTIWAATAAVAAMRGFTPEMDGAAALAEIDLAGGAIRRVLPANRPPGDRHSHVLGDLAVGDDGTVWVTDSGGPMLWRLAPGGAALEPWIENEEFLSLQGIVLLGGVAIVADHAAGLLRVDLAARKVRRLESPPDTSLIGLDGLALAPDGAVLAIQNGLRPSRVLRVEIDGDAESVAAVRVLEAAHLAMAAPSLGCVAAGGDFYFIGNAGWTRFENTDAAPTPPRAVPIFRTKLPKRQR
ncbi:MAG: tetratricopeptide repeat protein [Opitutaceae bacterium]|nr:tetratricopeptide repeat protein [Opitutaceae bacterium]